MKLVDIKNVESKFWNISDYNNSMHRQVWGKCSCEVMYRVRRRVCEQFNDQVMWDINEQVWKKLRNVVHERVNEKVGDLVSKNRG